MIPAVIGAGAWGTALALVAARACGRAILFARDPAKAANMEAVRENQARLPGVTLSANLRITSKQTELQQADLIIIATPAQAMRTTMLALSPNFRAGIPALIAAKGIERGTDLFMSEVLGQTAPKLEPFILSGPSFARDLAAELPTAVTLAGFSLMQATELASCLSTPALRIYASDDIRGVELGGAVKNVLAIACGIAEGLELGDSARAALTTRGFAELLRIGTVLGAKRETLMGLSGLGDLLLTCASHQSRNFSLGLRLGRGEPAIDPTGAVIEGAATTPVILAMAHARGIEMPVAEAVGRILDGQSSAKEEVVRLLSRPLKSEF